MKLIRTLLAGEGEGVCSEVGEGGTDCSGEIEGKGDPPGVGEEVGIGDPCASAKEDKMVIANARLALVVMSSEVETSLTVYMRRALPAISRDSSTSLGMTEAKHNSASSRSEKCCPAIRSRAEILHRDYLRQTDRADG